MEYQSLYRKFRPQTFNEMIGQSHITQTLKNQIMQNRVGHAYLFNGGRGTGKTSAAKILARAVNCLNPQDGEPCNKCEICKTALLGSLTDIVEMDAASNNGVDDIRIIREEVNFLPTLAKYRIYIIDEVHMLSTGAFNALLKTLEEPPSHVKFILATTEPQKLPATILSRCQRFDFKKIVTREIEKRLEEVCKSSNINIEAQALNVIAELSEGAMRDALSILERCSIESKEKITEQDVKDLVGIPNLVYINNLLASIINKDVNEVVQKIQEILIDGKDITNILWEIIKYAKDILVYKVTEDLKIYSEKEIKNIKQLSKNATKEDLLKIIFELSKLENEIKRSTQKQIIFEAGIIKLCYDNLQGEVIIKEKSKTVKKEEKQEILQKAEKPQEKPEIKSDSIKTTETNQDYWSEVLKKLKAQGKVILYTNLINTKAYEIDDMTVGIEFKNGITAFAKTILEKPENKQELEKLVSIELKKTMRIKLMDKNENAKKEKNELEELAGNMKIPINIIE